MAERYNGEEELRRVALENARSILLARRRAEEELLRAKEALEAQNDQLELLNRTGIALSSTLDLQVLVQAVTDAAVQLTGSEFGAFFYNSADETGEAFLLYALSGAPKEAFGHLPNPRVTPLFAPTFRGEGPIRLDDVRNDPRYGKMKPHHGMPEGHLAVASYLAAPVVSRSGEVLGGLFFGHPNPGVFTARHERLLLGVAAQAAVAIDNARLYEAAQKSAEERRRLLENEQRARIQAERASTMKDEFLATLSHELRTPLNAILGWSLMLRRGVPSPAELHRGLETIERNARTQAQLVEDLLDMNCIASGKVRLDVQVVDPVAVIDSAVETLRHAAETKEIRIRKTLDPAAGPISGDPRRLEQVIWNLLSNAIKFTPKQGRIQVLLERVDSHIEISVADTGVGIPPEFLPHVFDRFRQADASVTRSFGGLGLGLSIVKGLVELHGGAVHAASPGEGQGATFSLHLPLTPVYRRLEAPGRLHPGAATAAAPAFERIDLSGIRVLVVEDEPDARELIGRVLKECGADVLTAESAEGALAMIEDSKPHVLISDIGMPDIDGYELIRRVRAIERAGGRKLPAIALTAFARTEDRIRALRAGYHVHVAKPVEPSELIATVASVAGRSSA